MRRFIYRENITDDRCFKCLDVKSLNGNGLCNACVVAMSGIKADNYHSKSRAAIECIKKELKEIRVEEF